LFENTYEPKKVANPQVMFECAGLKWVVYTSDYNSISVSKMSHLFVLKYARGKSPAMFFLGWISNTKSFALLSSRLNPDATSKKLSWGTIKDHPF